jgi:hypothetical protein
MTKSRILLAPLVLWQGWAQAQIRVHAADLPIAAKGVYYSAPIDAVPNGRCDGGNIWLSMDSGSLPKGIDLTLSGLEGVPRELGVFDFTIRAQNRCFSVLRPSRLVVSPKPMLEAAPDEVAISCIHGQAPTARTILVFSTWTNLAYSAEVRDADWLKVKLDEGVTPGPDSALIADVATLTADPGRLEPGTYRGSIVFWTRDGANAPTVSVVLVVTAPTSGFTTPARPLP